ncbi:MAG: tetratricopeptide repeat protein [Xanthobacteraceae bacterium]|nr:tetratricopeptide repeat protein [Xanthobacteraceae bacterium]QYK45218.1 MAG: tetratricopeptide repeat protein [Xanthobacteraceae bacterium]
MRKAATRTLLIAGFGLLLLSGCKTGGSLDVFGNEEPKAASWDQPPAPQAFVDQQPLTPPEKSPVWNNAANNGPGGEALPGNNAADDLLLGKKHYREQNYGLAERHFRRAVEANPRNAEAWLGLAASYDRLRRFDLADRAYGQAQAILGPTPEVLSNHGYSYILRGDYKRAREKLLAAKAKDPHNPYVKNNLDLLADSVRNAR